MNSSKQIIGNMLKLTYAFVIVVTVTLVALKVNDVIHLTWAFVLMPLAVSIIAIIPLAKMRTPKPLAILSK